MINMIITYLLKGDTATAEEKAKELLKINPTHWGGRSWLGMVQLAKINKDKAITNDEELKKATEDAITNLEAGINYALKGHTLLANLGYGYAVTKRTDQAYAILAELDDLYKQERATGQDLAKVYAGLGENKKAVEWLEKDFVSRSGDLPHISWHPALKSLHNDPDFINLLQRIGLKPRKSYQNSYQ